MSSNNIPNHNGTDHTPEELAAAKLTAFALGQLPSDESSTLERGVDGNQREIREIESLSRAIFGARAGEPPIATSPELKTIIGKQLEDKPMPAPSKKQRRHWPIVEVLVAGGVALTLLALLMPASHFAPQASLLERSVQRVGDATSDPTAGSGVKSWKSTTPAEDGLTDLQMMVTPRIIVQEEEEAKLGIEVPSYAGISGATNQFSNQIATELPFRELNRGLNAQGTPMPGGEGSGRGGYGGIPGGITEEERKRQNEQLKRIELSSSASVAERLAAKAQSGNIAEIEVAVKAVEVSKAEYDQSLELRRKNPGAISETHLRKDRFNYEKSIAQLKQATKEKQIAGLSDKTKQALVEYEQRLSNSLNYERSGEQYAPIYENSFLSPLRQPLSTFSIDVDTASYANTRRFLTSGRLPPPDAVRIEELVNYFRYDYPQPKDEKPFSVNMETAECPWREGHLLLRVGLKGKDVERGKRPVSNLVFLLDVSGSMSDANKLPLLKTAMKMLVGELGENDRVSIVTYAGDAGLKLPSARGHEQKRINAAIDSLSAGGSTNGSAGIELAYEQATAHFIEGGTNRVILCTDGDLNVGVTSDQALVELIKRKAASHVFLTVLGFGEGNLQDAKMERLADNGNGLYAYIDSVREARKVLVEQLTGSTITIAKDVKIQIEFNPAQIAAYRLLGYENRVMAAQDFNNDKKDAGEIGAGHTVTALYELVPVGAAVANPEQPQPGVDALKYQQPGANLLPEKREVDPFGGAPGPSLVPAKDASGELLTLKLRFKQPEGETSQLLEYPLKDRGHSFNSASPDFQFAAAVASFGMVLRNSQHRGNSNLAAVAEIATGAIGTDAGGYRAEFVDLVRKAQGLSR